ncbi:hypothetical protein [Opitutus terrae]|uniref:Uncharacterized protein n=1 Tax=Opitutus terrae (strain DSM 11246 / JCM 15787 / PB90-1) TaxID=452637 RepID=B1ZNB3_OPITP|nr:hypothetical protein [Opitutus terrae]ACB73482.1 hypothetical protein Oter_0191 [Opitutus terrae PB90-1]
MIFPVRLVTWLALAFATIVGLHAEEPSIIARARARLASEAILDGVTSIHYVGTLVTEDPANSATPLRQAIEIYLQKPAQQRIVITSDDTIEISALDGYDAWRRTIDARNPDRWQQSQMGSEQVKQLRADVWENLSFYRGIERVGGWVKDEGVAVIDGISCRKVAFHHDDDLVYLRYFDQASGRLVYTGTEMNNFREDGEIHAGGIRFPKSIVISQTAEGHTSKRTITFDQITVNERFPASLFAVPLPTVK